MQVSYRDQELQALYAKIVTLGSNEPPPWEVSRALLTQGPGKVR